MNITTEQISAGLIKYIDTEIGARATGLTKFMVYFAAPSLPKLVTSKIEELKSNELFKDMFDENGNVVFDELYKRTKDAISKSGKILIPQINYFVDMDDVEILANLIKKS